MAAIGAIFARDGAPVASDDIARMTAALRVHGSRKQDRRRLGAFGLAATLGEIHTPEDAFEQQPLVAGEHGFVFAGRLDYRADLVAALGLEPSAAKTMPDSALAHAAWRKWGKAAFLKLEGNWALVAVDEAAQLLTAAVSPLAGQPLVYHETARRLAMASAPRGLFALPDIQRKVDEQRVADALILNFEDATRTYFEDVRMLLAGHWLEASRDTITVRRYYDLDHVEPLRLSRDEDYVEAADALMRDAIRSNLRAVRTPSATVSAGLDSTTVTVYALEALADGVDGLSDPLIGFTHVPCQHWDGRCYGYKRLGDESGPVKALMRDYPQLSVDFVDSEGLPLDHGLDEVIRLSEMPPFGMNNLHWGLEIMRRTKASGRNVQLTGQSGNRTLSFSNVAIFPMLFRQGRWRELYLNLRGLDVPQNMVKRLYRWVFSPMLPAPAVKAIARLRGDRTHQGYTGYSSIAPDYAAEMRVAERARERGWDDSFGTIRSPRQMREHMTLNGNSSQGALTRLAMQSQTGVQSRDPLGCRRITEYCLAIPDEQFMHRGEDRWLIKRLMANRLPPEILHARRGRQSADWHYRFSSDLARYRDELERAAEDPAMARRFDIARLRQLFDSWPDRTPVSYRDHPDYLLAMVGVGRMIGMSRFINWVEGKN